MSAYHLIIVACCIIILSYLFGIVSKKTNIPSVIMLILLGAILSMAANAISVEIPDLMPALEILGIVGLIMIVLEGALELEITREKQSLIFKSLLTALISLLGCTVLIAFIIKAFFDYTWLLSAVYATPLSIISSAIVIPSVSNLIASDKEYLIYESTLSDILGIMLFYFLIGLENSTSFGSEFGDFVGLSLLTIVISVVLSFGLILLFQRIKVGVKLFLLISTLILMYSLGKLFHLSSLLLILIFGLFLKNHLKIFGGWLKKYSNKEVLNEIVHEFELVTIETAFVIRTFFFVVFGMTIEFAGILAPKTLLVSLLALVVIYGLRYLSLRITSSGLNMPKPYIAPRGLITILLFYAIPVSMTQENFPKGVLLLVIIISSIIMSWAMIKAPRSGDENGKPADLEPTDLEGQSIQEIADKLSGNSGSASTSNLSDDPEQ